MTIDPPGLKQEAAKRMDIFELTSLPFFKIACPQDVLVKFFRRIKAWKQERK